MHIHLADDDRISLTINEITILHALTKGLSSGYQLAKTCDIALSTLYPALKRLELGRLIQAVEPTDPTPHPGKPRQPYQLTPIGQLILEQHLTALRRLIS